ncbi:MAG: dicarboxylate/amino acid:cation symporter [Planctomycetota bacterium]
MRRFFNLPNVILLSLALGVLFGWIAGSAGLLKAGFLLELLKLGGDLFKSLIFMVIVPLVFVSLICGMMSIGDLRKLGRVAGRTLVLYFITAALACIVAIFLVNAIKPGHAIAKETRDRIAKEHEAKQKEIVGKIKTTEHTPWTFIRGIVPNNVFSVMTSNSQMLPVIFFALLFGLCAAMIDSKRREHLAYTFESLSLVMVRMIQAVMFTAPVGVFCLIAVATASIGIEVVKAMALYCVVVVLALSIQFFVVYGGVIRLLTRLRFTDFVRACRPALVTAFSTSSSAASLPVNMECVNKRLNVSTSVTSFVLPIGTTVNMDGTAIMQTVATVFIAQLYAIDLTVTQQIGVILTAMLAAVGTAPVPAAGIAMLVIILEPLGIPLTGIALIWAVDRPLDMLRTVVNVVGDGVAAAAVGTMEGEDVKYVPEEAAVGFQLPTGDSQYP